jgi:hypothetical protein
MRFLGALGWNKGFEVFSLKLLIRLGIIRARGR